eukprot:14022890-Alexandrium_andersonii.AAC.1
MFAPQLVAGELHDRVVEALALVEHQELLVLSHGIPPSDFSGILSDFFLARSEVIHQLTVKLHFATMVPTALCGIMHPDEEVARHVAMRCVEQYDSTPDSEHHPQSVRALDPSQGCRSCIDAFIRGKARADLDDVFWHVVGPL